MRILPKYNPDGTIGILTPDREGIDSIIDKDNNIQNIKIKELGEEKIYVKYQLNKACRLQINMINKSDGIIYAYNDTDIKELKKRYKEGKYTIGENRYINRWVTWNIPNTIYVYNEEDKSSTPKKFITIAENKFIWTGIAEENYYNRGPDEKEKISKTIVNNKAPDGIYDMQFKVSSFIQPQNIWENKDSQGEYTHKIIIDRFKPYITEVVMYQGGEECYRRDKDNWTDQKKFTANANEKTFVKLQFSESMVYLDKQGRTNGFDGNRIFDNFLSGDYFNFEFVKWGTTKFPYDTWYGVLTIKPEQLNELISKQELTINFARDIVKDLAGNMIDSNPTTVATYNTSTHSWDNYDSGPIIFRIDFQKQDQDYEVPAYVQSIIIKQNGDEIYRYNWEDRVSETEEYRVLKYIKGKTGYIGINGDLRINVTFSEDMDKAPRKPEIYFIKSDGTEESSLQFEGGKNFVVMSGSGKEWSAEIDENYLIENKDKLNKIKFLGIKAYKKDSNNSDAISGLEIDNEPQSIAYYKIDTGVKNYEIGGFDKSYEFRFDIESPQYISLDVLAFRCKLIFQNLLFPIFFLKKIIP